MIDHLYNKIGARILHLVIVNQTSSLNDGVDRNGAPVDNWSLDTLIKLIQTFYRQMGFQSKLKAWFKHSSRVMLKNKSHIFVQETYTKGIMWMISDTWLVDHVYYQLKKSSTQKYLRKLSFLPYLVLEISIISEYLLLLDCTREHPGIKYLQENMWQVFSKVTTKLRDMMVEEHSKVSSMA